MLWDLNPCGIYPKVLKTFALRPLGQTCVLLYEDDNTSQYYIFYYKNLYYDILPPSTL